MNALLEPFVFEAVAEHQHALRDSARAPARATAARDWRRLLHVTFVPCRRERVMTPCLGRLLGFAR